MLSEFNEKFVKELGTRITPFSFQEGKKQVRLYAVFNGRRVNFANLRSPRTKKADVWLKGYMATDTSLLKKQRGLVYQDGRSEIFFKSEDLDDAVDAVVRHFNDLVKRVKAYEESTVKTSQRGIGIPSDYFK